MAKLAAVVDSLDAVAEPLREMYVPGEGGKFILDADIDAHPATAGLRSKNNELIRSEKDLKTKFKPFEGMDPEKIQAAITAQQKADEEKQRQEGNFETLKQQMTTEREKERKAFEEKEGGYVTTIKSFVVDAATSAAITAEDGNALLEPHVTRQVQAVQQDGKWKAVVLDKKGNVRFNSTTGDEMTIRELVAEMRTKDEYKAGFNAPNVSGSGAKPNTNRGTGGNIRLTKDQQRDPATYRRAKEEAAKRGVQVEFTD